MGMQSFDQDGGINDINITPFVDVVLVLLVIFMVTAPILAKQAMEINLPSAVSSENQANNSIGISITKNDQIFLAGNLVMKETLESLLLAQYESNPRLEVLVSADKDTRHGSVIEVVDAIKKAGIENFAFQIERIIER
jgi:biopolymer transport protein ExbD